MDKITAKQVSNRLQHLEEFKDTQFDPKVLKYAAERLNRIRELEGEISKMLMERGVVDEPVTIKMGPEIEIYNVAGDASFTSRTQQLANASRQATKTGQSFEHLLAKKDGFMPKEARAQQLTKSFRSKIEHARSVTVSKEHAHHQQTAIEWDTTGDQMVPHRIAIFQNELVSPPRNPESLAFYLAAIGQRVIDKAPEYGLTRTEIRSTMYDLYPSGFHCHMSLTGSKNGEKFNLLSRDSYPEEKGRRKADPKQVSQMMLHIGEEMNKFLAKYVYVFAPTESAFDRFNEHNFGASFIGFNERRERGRMPAAMIRGEGRECDRPDNPIQRQDQGDLRVELRLPAVDCIGHPNKRAYNDQLMAPFDVSEAMVFMLYKGVKSWAKAYDKAQSGKSVTPKTEKGLYEQEYGLPESAGEAATLMKNSQQEDAEFLQSADRAETIAKRGFNQQRIHALDRSPDYHPLGQSVDRSDLLPRGRARGRA